MRVDEQQADLDQLTILSKQTSIRGGVFEVAHDITVRGILEGEITVGGRIDVLNGAEVEGSVKAKEAIIAGRVRGDLTVDGMLILRATSIVDGHVRAGSIMVEEGACGGITISAGPDSSTLGEQERRGGARKELADAMARARTAVASARGLVAPPEPAQTVAWPGGGQLYGSEAPPRDLERRSTDEMMAAGEMRDIFGGRSRGSEGAQAPDSAWKTREETES